jgi:hypothetical protein
MPRTLYVDHPVTGERVSLNQLAASAGLYPATVCRRYGRGERGLALIAPVPSRSKTLRKTNEARRLAESKTEHLPAYSQRCLMSAPRLGDLGRMKEATA